jgi:hypothetical protein
MISAGGRKNDWKTSVTTDRLHEQSKNDEWPM